MTFVSRQISFIIAVGVTSGLHVTAKGLEGRGGRGGSDGRGECRVLLGS